MRFYRGIDRHMIISGNQAKHNKALKYKLNRPSLWIRNRKKQSLFTLSCPKVGRPKEFTEHKVGLCRDEACNHLTFGINFTETVPTFSFPFLPI